MNKIEKGSIKALIIYMVAIAVGGIIIWPILDIIFAAVFTHSEFTYSVKEHIIEPIIFGCIAGVVFWVFDRIKISRNRKSK